MMSVKTGKPFWQSKTFWLNILSAATFIASGQLGVDVPAEIAAPILAAANIATRFVTDEPIRLSSRAPAP